MTAGAARDPSRVQGPRQATDVRSALRGLGVLTAALLLTGAVFAGLLTATGRYTSHLDDASAMAVGARIAPEGVLDLSRLAPTITAEYQHAADHAEHYRALRCWCGCEAAFDHASLLECFVTADGSWEAHGAGCAVCLGEAATARQRLAAGVPITAIAAEIDATYGPASLPTSARQEPAT
jgi:DNA-binding helix-hairpin-helix protein with protein kinase domain